MDTKELTIIAEKSGVEKTKAQMVLAEFTAFFEQASEWETKTRGLVITDVSQVAEMKLAREGRLQLKEIRVAAEKTKKRLKESILIEGRFIDAIYNLIEGVTAPLEKDLLEKEKFVERIEEAKKAKLIADRKELLEGFEIDYSYVDLGEISEEKYQKFLAVGKKEYEDRKERERKIEAERIERERADAEEKARIHEENERLKRETDAMEAAIREEIEKREAAERALREKAESERKAKEAAEREAMVAADRKAKASDIDKIRDYIAQIRSISVPEVKSDAMKQAVIAILEGISKAERLIMS